MRRWEISSFLKFILRTSQIPVPYIFKEGRGLGQEVGPKDGEGGESPNVFVHSWSDQKLLKSQWNSSSHLAYP